jgi:hypothetical protein
VPRQEPLCVAFMGEYGSRQHGSRSLALVPRGERRVLPGRFHAQFRDKNRRGIGKSQSKWTAKNGNAWRTRQLPQLAQLKMRGSVLAAWQNGPARVEHAGTLAHFGQLFVDGQLHCPFLGSDGQNVRPGC